MKLSVSAFQASCSASAQKILHHHAPSYGSTSSTAAAVLQPAPIQHSTPPHLAKRPNPTVKVEEVEGNCSSPSPPPPPSAGSLAGPSSRGHHRSSATSSRAMVDSTGVVAPSTPAAAQNVARGDSSDASVPSSRSVSQEEKSNLSSALPSLGTSREEEAVGSDHASDASDRSSSNAGNRYQNSGRGGSSRCSPHPPLDRSKSTGERRWANLRAVVALYGRLRQIKRTKSNQRWMKLRTTVQLSGAISNTIQKKAPLKREDSFLKRFSTRQVAEQQETMDAGEDSEGGGGSGGGTISHCQAKARRRRKAQQEKRSVVNPDENFYFYWLMVLTVCVLYNLWTLIVRQSFPELQRIIQPTWFMLDALTDVIFLLDIAVQFRTGYLEQGLVVYNSKKLASHYIHSRAFLLDVSSLTPLDLLQFNLGINPILRFPRFLKVYRIYDYYYMVESRTVYPNLWRVVNLVHILLILAHWFGCFYFLLSEAEGFQGEWVYPYRPGDYATLSRKYLGSLYWSTLTLTTIGDLPTPETNAEGGSSARNGTAAADAGPHANNPHPIAQPRRGLKTRLLQFNSNNGYIFTIVSYLIGVFIFATIVGQVGNVITNRNANRLEFERLLDGAKTYMRHHKVPGDMKRRVLRWYDYSWSRGRIQGGGDINTALGLLPDKLKTELALHVNLSVLKKVTIFQECQPEFLHDLVLKMKAYIFTPGDLICRKGEVAREMFIIADGILEVISETGRVLTTMKAGDFFGEIGILNLDGLNKRTADVRSVGYSELFSLSREDVLTAMKDYPEAQEILQSLGRKRLMEARNVSKNYKVARSTSKRRISGENLCVGGGGVGPAGDSSDSTGKRIVDKIRSDVKGLKNALRKSRRSTSRSSKEDSIELQPLTKDGKNVDYTNPSQTTKAPKLKKLLLRSINVDSSTSHDSTSGPSTSSGSKGVLRRMTRVHSDEAATEPQESPQREMIGAGLPLLQRLLLLKAKEDREEKQAKEHEVVSPPPPPPAKQKVASPPSPLPPAPSVAPSGLPLIQRLLALKQQQREEATKVAAEAPPKSPPPPPTTLITPPTISPPPVVSPPLQKLPTIIRAEEAPPLPPRATVEQKPPVPARPPPLEPSPPPVEAPVALPVNKSPPPVRISPPPVRISPSPASKSPSPVRKSSPPIRKSPPPAIKSPPPAFKSPPPPFATPPPAVTSPPAITSPPERPQKPSLLQLRQDTKFYMSVDDLSPEYSGLPFVKKLKILNERQKLIELQEQRAAGVLRSSSLDSAAAHARRLPAAPPRRTRSDCSVQRRRPLVTPPDLELTLRMLRCCEDGPSTPPSPESNETEERRNLKSILKKLSSNNSSSEQESGGGGVADTERKSPTTSRIEFRKLMRAQTVEGYAARHSKFSKSVTFDRETLQSPPADSTAPRIEPPPQQPPSVKAKMGFLLPSLMLTQQSNETRKEEEFFGDIITGMKQVIQNHLEEVQNKFHKRYQSLELEVKRRDEIISQLQNRIQELEGGPITNGCPEKEEDAEAEEVERRTSRITRGGSSEEGDISDQEETFSDQPFMRGDSVDTVISPSGSPVLMDSSDDEADRVQCSWEEHAAEETLELLDLPRSMSPQSVWHVSVDVPSSSSSSNSSSSTSPLSSPPIHNQDWEVQMLADELERRDQRQKLAEQLTGRSQQLSRSEVDILDRILQEQSSRRGKVAKNLSFDAEGEQKRKGDARKTTSVEHLVLRRRRKGSLTSWLQRKDTSTSALGRQQVLNARSLEEPIQQPERRPKGTRSSSIGHLPSGRSLFTSLSRFRLSIRGLSSSRPAAPTTPAQPDPESAVATISSQTHDQS